MDVFVPERLILIREKLGISKAEAARRVGLSKMGYGRYESGERIPSVQTIEAKYVGGLSDGKDRRSWSGSSRNKKG